jgi:hypothetical protein
VKKSKPKILYIDDENDASTEAIKDGLKDTGIIDVDYSQAEDFKDQLITFENELSNYDGLMLDLRLDGNPGIDLKHTAVSLAQELRAKTAAKEKYVDIPIILCSTDQKIKALYEKDQTSHDLFDYIFLKEATPNWEKHSIRLKSIVNGYKAIRDHEFKLEKIFHRDISKLDQRMFGKFLDEGESYPVHDLAQHIIKELIRQPGPLINETLLASRLGIDIEKSADWNNLINGHFINANYTGVFAVGWIRWWSDLIIEIFKELTDKRLSAFKAVDRVNLLKGICKLNKLFAAEPITKSISTNFWTICEYYQKPLDPLEGFKVFEHKEPKPWQEYRYLSFEAAAERRGKIHPSEKERLEQYKRKFLSK